MRKLYQRLAIICFCLVIFSGVTLADDIYVTGVTKITMRTGPGTEHKIVSMLKSGTKLEIVEYQSDWTQVRTDQGKIGWVLSRFLTQRVPDALMVERLENDNQQLLSKLKAVEEENQTLTVKNATLIQIEEKYKELKQKSSDFLKLDARFKEMTHQYEAQKTQIQTLENDLNNEPKLWFLIGPGVFIVGLFFGLSRRKKRSSSLI